MNSIDDFIKYIEQQKLKANRAYTLSDETVERQFYYVQEIVFADLLGKLKVIKNKGECRK